MGLIKAGAGALGSTLGDQWKEYFYCDSIPETILAVKGEKRTSKRSSNKHGSENVISTGSVIAVADGQCMMIVEQGKVVDLCSEPGEFVYDAETEPSIFASGLNSESVKRAFEIVGKRFQFGGETPMDQRVYYFNTKELIGNKYGTPSPVPFRVVDQRAGIDMDIGISCFGEYSFRITNPLLFYTNVCSNIQDVYERATLEGQMKSELLTALQPAFSMISDMGVRYSSIPAHTMELANALNDVLSSKWRDLRGIEIVSLGVSSMKASEENEQLIKEMQRDAAYRDAGLGAAAMVGATTQAMRDAARNEAVGAPMAFMGMNMAQQTGGVNAQDLYALGAQQQMAQAQAAAAQGGTQATVQGWTCPSCGAIGQGKFCAECGTAKPAGAPLYKCDKCGWVPADPANPPKFCPECGDPFNEDDIQ